MLLLHDTSTHFYTIIHKKHWSKFGNLFVIHSPTLTQSCTLFSNMLHPFTHFGPFWPLNTMVSTSMYFNILLHTLSHVFFKLFTLWLIQGQTQIIRCLKSCTRTWQFIVVTFTHPQTILHTIWQTLHKLSNTFVYLGQFWYRLN